MYVTLGNAYVSVFNAYVSVFIYVCDLQNLHFLSVQFTLCKENINQTYTSPVEIVEFCQLCLEVGCNPTKKNTWVHEYGLHNWT